MVSKSILVVGYLLLFSSCLLASGRALHNVDSSNTTSLASSMELPSFNAASSSMDSDCTFPNPTEESKPTVTLNLKRRSLPPPPSGDRADSVVESTAKDLTRIQTLHRRIVEKKNRSPVSRLNKVAVTAADDDNHKLIPPEASPESYVTGPSAHLVATLESGVSLGSGEYFMDVYIGTPPKHFSLILDTGSDLNWIQCLPCNDCFEQHGPYYDPEKSTSYRNISCRDPRCHLVSSPEPPRACENEAQSCPYYYWYGDSSNTTGDFALETFTVNLTSDHGSRFEAVQSVMFGCGHWNRGLFHGAAGLLGLGRGPLSFSSQLKSLYGESFSYCLVDRNSDPSVTSKLIFGEDKDLLNHKELNFTAMVSGREDDQVDTFYYVQIKSILVDNEVLNIPEETWNFTSDGSGGTIIDSGTTLSYFADPAYKIVKEAFERKVKKYPKVEDFPILDPCYNVSGSDKLDLPSFGIVFGDGAVWNFPLENYFIKFEHDEIVCLAVLGTPRSALSIIGNYQQQNFHVLYDAKRSRLGYVPRNCADM